MTNSDEITRRKLLATSIGSIGAGFTVGYFYRDRFSNSNEFEQPDDLLVTLENRPLIGDPSSHITVVMWTDFLCPFCWRFMNNTYPDILTEFINTGVVKMFIKPVAGLGQVSNLVARSSHSVHLNYDLDGVEYMEWKKSMMRYLFETEEDINSFEPTDFVNIVSEYDIRGSAFVTDMDRNEEKYNEFIDVDQSELERINQQIETPFFVLYNTDTQERKQIVGSQPIDEFRTKINGLLQE